MFSYQQIFKNMFHNGLNFVLFTFEHDTNIPIVERQNLISNHT